MEAENSSPLHSESESELTSIDLPNNQEDKNHLKSRPTLERQLSTGWENLRDTVKSPAFDEQKRKKAWRESLQKCVDDMRTLLFSSTSTSNFDLSNEEIDLFAKIFDVQFATNLEEYSEAFFDTLKYQEIAQVARDIQGHLADVVARIPDIPTPKSSPTEEAVPLSKKGLKAVSKSAAFVNFTTEQLVDKKKERKRKLSDVIKRLQKFEELPPEVAETFGITPIRQQLFGNLREFQSIVSQACEHQGQEKLSKEKVEEEDKKNSQKYGVTFDEDLSEEEKEDEDDRATYYTDVFGDYLRKNRRDSGSQLIGGAIAEEEEDTKEENNPLSAIMNLTKKLQERAEKKPDDEQAAAEEEERRRREVEDKARRDQEEKARLGLEAKCEFQAKVDDFLAGLLEMETKIRHLGDEMGRFRDLISLHTTILDTEPKVEPTMLEKKLFNGLREHVEICDELKEAMESANSRYHAIFRCKFHERREATKAKRRSWAAGKIQSNWKRYSARKRFQQLVADIKSTAGKSNHRPSNKNDNNQHRGSLSSLADSGISMLPAEIPSVIMKSSVPPLWRKGSNSSLSSWSSKASSSSSESSSAGRHFGARTSKSSKTVREPSSPPTLIRRLRITEQIQQQPFSPSMSTSSSPGTSKQHSPSLNRAIVTKKVLNNAKNGGSSVRSSSPASSRGSPVARSDPSSRNSSVDAGRILNRVSPAGSFTRLPKI